MPPGRPRKEKSPLDDRVLKLSMREFMEKQNVIAHALSVQHDMTNNQLQACVQQMQVCSEAMVQLQSSTKAVLESNGIVDNYSMFDFLPSISKLLKSENFIGNPLSAPLGHLSVFSRPDGLVKQKKKRNRKPRPPNAPKQPITAYFLFLEANRDRIRSELPPDTPPGAIQKRGTDMWNSLPEEEKEVYKAEYRRNFVAYKEEMKKWATTDLTVGAVPNPPFGDASAGRTNDEGGDADDSEELDSNVDDYPAVPESDHEYDMFFEKEGDTENDESDAEGDEVEVGARPALAIAPTLAPAAPARSTPTVASKGRKNVPVAMIDPALTSAAAAASAAAPPPISMALAPAAPATASNGAAKEKKAAKKAAKDTPPVKDDSPEDGKKNKRKRKSEETEKTERKRKGDEAEKTDKKRKRKDNYGEDY